MPDMKKDNNEPQKIVNRTSISRTLLLIFIVLKLCGVITWSWWWVFSPIWLPFFVLFFVCSLAVVLGGE
jgi:fatty-acid desaturase